MEKKTIDITGQRFGRFRAIKHSGRINGYTYWLCECDCGTIKKVESYTLRKGKSKSCGCYRDELTSKVNLKNNLRKKHRRVYRIYNDMKTRCYNKNYKNRDRYGGRGIKICDEWLESFESFLDWSLKNNYSDELTIDRIDVDGNYSPENCRWTDKITQANNTSTNHFIEINGVSKTIAQWCVHYDLSQSQKYTAYTRVTRGWTGESIFIGNRSERVE